MPTDQEAVVVFTDQDGGICQLFSAGLTVSPTATQHCAGSGFMLFLTAVPGSILSPRSPVSPQPSVATVGHFHFPPQARKCGRDFWQGRHCSSARRTVRLLFGTYKGFLCRG